MSNPLLGAFMKLKRAYGHLQELQGATKAYVESDPYETVMEPIEPKPPAIESYVIRADEKQAPKREEWGAMIGDVVHNLRSALDHLVWELTKREQGGPPDPLPRDWRRIGFPIHRTQDANSMSQLGEKLWGVNPDAKAEIEWLQPYTIPKPEEHPLEILNALWNTDKHRHVHLVAVHVVTGEPGYIAAGRMEFEFTKGNNIELGPKAELFRIHRLEIRPESPGMEMHVRVGAVPHFPKGPPANGGEVTETLYRLYEVVSAILLGFEPHLS